LGIFHHTIFETNKKRKKKTHTKQKII